MYDVYLYIYDLSNGLAAQISVQLTGKFFKAIHHTSIVYHGREYCFGRFGVESSPPGASPYGSPIERRLVGPSEVSLVAWQEFLRTCEETYGVGKYHLLEHNCNTFSDAALQRLLGQRLDAEILSLPKDFLGTPLGVLLRPQIDAMYNVRAQPAVGNGIHAASDSAATIQSQGMISNGKADQAYSFSTCPTLDKLFASLSGRGKSLGRNDTERQQLRSATEIIFSGQADCSKESQSIVTFLQDYFDSSRADEIFPGIDLLRVLILYASFAVYMYSAGGRRLLCTILSKDIEEYQNSAALYMTVLKLISNASTVDAVRPMMIDSLKSTSKLDLITNAPLSADSTIAQLGLKVIWNLFILADGIDDDFAVASLAAVAESNANGKQEIVSLRQKLLDEFMSKDSGSIQEMVELLELRQSNA